MVSCSIFLDDECFLVALSLVYQLWCRYPMVVRMRTTRSVATVDSGIQSLAKADGSSRKTVYFKKFGHCIQL